jgi:hypothetical protein
MVQDLGLGSDWMATSPANGVEGDPPRRQLITEDVPCSSLFTATKPDPVGAEV